MPSNYWDVLPHGHTGYSDILHPHALLRKFEIFWSVCYTPGIPYQINNVSVKDEFLSCLLRQTELYMCVLLVYYAIIFLGCIIFALIAIRPFLIMSLLYMST